MQSGFKILLLALVVLAAACINIDARCDSAPNYGRALLQSQANASSTAIDNKGDQVGTEIANASSTASATATSYIPLPPTQQCIQFEETNYSGQVLYFVYGVGDISDCCSLCKNQAGCNVFVYCGRADGCDNGYGVIYPGNLCTLKYQRLAAGTEADAYGRGPGVQWSSGIVSTSSLGYCIGYAEAAASAAATAGCNSIAYASAVAYAVDACGNEASASAISVAVGPKCPPTCQDAINNLRASNCQDISAIETASLLCGAAQFSELAADICPTITCEQAVATAQASATADGCDSAAYSAAVARAVNSCGEEAYASAAASAITTCPVSCQAAIAAAQAEASASGCNSTAFATAQATAIGLCGASAYADAAASVNGVCTIGLPDAGEDDAPPANLPPVTEEPKPISPIAPIPADERPIIIAPLPGTERPIVLPGVLPEAEPQPEPLPVVTPEILPGRLPASEPLLTPPANEPVTLPIAVDVIPPQAEAIAVPLGPTLVGGPTTERGPGPAVILPGTAVTPTTEVQQPTAGAPSIAVLTPTTEQGTGGTVAIGTRPGILQPVAEQPPLQAGPQATAPTTEQAPTTASPPSTESQPVVTAGTGTEPASELLTNASG